MTQLPFEPRKLARTEDPDTSKAAARSCQSTREDHHEAILHILHQHFHRMFLLVDHENGEAADLTADEIASISNGKLNRHQVGRRLHELVAAGKVRTTGRCRPTPTGRMAQCYEIVE